ncbi:ornithine cyclodeaminase family protein [Sphingopyxis chilensis]|uniref:ornithine cyclodeaminase family protein n=1 Tax=Sphingopyxis chilensis TaxID=180400 RepID=UPI002DDCE91B|nr:hypothetical protein [Sphingopyxis chilensis]
MDTLYTPSQPAIVLDDQAVAERLPWVDLLEAIEHAVGATVVAPRRHRHKISSLSGEVGEFLIMPAWQDDQVLGLKLVTYWSQNSQLGQPTHGASYILLDARSGQLRAMIAAETLTHRRTAALSILSARRLAHPDARRLSVLGAGPLAESLVRGHFASGRFASITVHARSTARAEVLVGRLNADGIDCALESDLESAVSGADMIASATAANEPFLHGDWLSPSAHIDLFGSFTPRMRESDDRLMSRASEIWVDTLSAVDESGDLIDAIAAGVINRASVSGDFASLLAKKGDRVGGISVFKSVGIAAADFAAAKLVLGLSQGHDKVPPGA